MAHHDNNGDRWLLQFVNGCQVLGLARTRWAADRALQLLSSVPPTISPLQESVARRVLARAAYAVGRSQGRANSSHFSGAMIQLTLGVDLRSDGAAAIDAAAEDLAPNACGGLDSDATAAGPPAAESHHIDRPNVLGPATGRWVSLVEPIMRLESDVPTISRWSLVVAKSQGVIKTWCAAAGVSAGDSLDFARLLRVALLYGGCRPDWHNLLDIIDQRTLARLLERSCVGRVSSIPDVETFLKDQRLVSSPALLSAINSVVHGARIDATRTSRARRAS